MCQEKRYWIYGDGAADAVVLATDKDSAPEIWFRSGWDQPQPAKGLNFRMLFQSIVPTAVKPFCFEGAAKEALQALRRDVAVYRIELRLMAIAFDENVGLEKAVVDLQKEEIRSLFTQSEIIDRIKELDFIPLILQAIRMDRGEAGEKRLRERLQRTEVKALEELFFAP